MGNDKSQKPTRHAAPHRQFRRGAVAVAVVDQGQVLAVARAVLSRVRDIRNAQGEGSYVFGDPGQAIFALRIGSAAGEGMLREHSDWLFGLYGADTADGKRVTFPSIDQVAEDIREHYGWEQAPSIREPAQLEFWAVA
ncbi:hypothetical protein [Lelliottia jeotgali]